MYFKRDISMTDKLVSRLKFGAMNEVMTVLTPEEASALYLHIESLYTRIEDKEAKFVAMCDHTYELVKINRDLKKQMGQL